NSYTPGCPSGPWDGSGWAPHAHGRRTALPALGLLSRRAASSPTGSRERETNLALSVGLGEAPHTLNPVGRARLDLETTVQSPHSLAQRPQGPDSGQRLHSGVGHRRMGQAQGVKKCQATDLVQPGVGDLGAAQV